MTSPVSEHPPLRSRFFIGLALGILVGVSACWGFGLFATSYHSTEESKICFAALQNDSAKLNPQTREYLKARLYWNAAVWMTRPQMSGWNFDFGPVDDSALAGLVAIKDASSSADVYRDALSKHGVTPKPQ